MRLALIHDWLNQIGGAEDVLTDLVSLYPDAPIYTSLYWRTRMPADWQRWHIRPLWTDRLPGIHRHHQRYLPVYPLAFGSLKLSGYDVVLSNKSGFCHGIQVAPGTPHICYCLTPTRYVWQYDDYASRERLGGGLRKVIRPLLDALKRWDYAAAQRVDHFIAISSEVQARIQRFYKRDSTLIYPPVDTQRFTLTDQIADYYLVVSRLIPYKRIDLAVAACTRLGLPLIVAGTGRDRERLEALAGPTIRFVGYIPDADLPQLMGRCRAFIFPGLEDFGITPVQAQAAGRPVIAFRGGGALDTVLPGISGEFFNEQTVDALVTTLEHFNTTHYAPQAIRNHALIFDSNIFQSKITAFIAQTLGIKAD